MQYNILMLTRYDRKGASSRHRFYHYRPFLVKAGYRCDIRPLLNETYLTLRYRGNKLWVWKLLLCYVRRVISLYKLNSYSLVIIEKELFPYIPYWIERLFLSRVNYVLDYDDATFHSYVDSGNAFVRLLLKNKISKLMRRSELVISGNEYLDNYAVLSGAPRTVVIKDGVDFRRYDGVSESKRRQFTIIWIGTPSTAHYIKIVEPALKFAYKNLDARFVMIGGRYDIDGISVEYLDWSDKTEVELIKGCHVGIMPLYDSGWENGKCGFKLIQYMASKLAVVASPVGVNKDMVEQGVNGYLANSNEEWIKAFQDIYNSNYKKMGEYGYQKVKAEYNIDLTSKALIDNISSIVGSNVDDNLVSDFGREWSLFDNNSLGKANLEKIWRDYFLIFPWNLLPESGGVGVDIGCGSGRWARFVLPRVESLHLMDPSKEALSVAEKNLAEFKNAQYHNLGVDLMPFEDETLDFAYSLGVLHHVPDINSALSNIRKKLKSGAPFLIYLYYSMDNKPIWFQGLWKISDYFRRVIVKFPYSIRYIISQVIAILVYFPLIIIGRALRFFGVSTSNWPLSYYIDKKFYTARNDALDRFGTLLENRYSRKEIEKLLQENGFDDIRFSEKEPFWCAVCVKK